jgi:tetratricopeptide (TPR) repeat protein
MRKTGLALLLFVLAGHAQDTHTHANGSSSKDAANRYGSVQFATSCSPAVQADFNNAVAILHSFEYDEAHEAFAAILRKDPTCAMARWGETMSYFHGLWSEYDAANGAKAAAEARKTAAENPKTTAREKAYIAAISQIFSDQAIISMQRPDNKPDAEGYSRPSHEAELQYTASMAGLHTQFPDDREATIFYALALAISSNSSDKTHADLHQCTALLNPLFLEMPNHPGVAHYIIHCNDNPEMASDGLNAARKYAEIAPASAHATHMPAHIFAQLGLWDEMMNSNRISLRASEKDVNATPCEKFGNSQHSMSFLVIGLVQTGQMAEARKIVERSLTFKSSVPGAAQCVDKVNEVLMPYMLETADWSWAKDMTVEPNDWMYWFTTGLAAARTGDTARAGEAEQNLVALRDKRASQPGIIPQNQGEVFRLAVAGWRAQQAGKKDEAVHDLRAAADLQDRLGRYVIDKPVREMLADLLALNGNPTQALAEYKTVLAQKPNRFDSLYGAGSAAFALGDAPAASAYYKQLLAFAKGDERPEIATARARTGDTASKVTASIKP